MAEIKFDNDKNMYVDANLRHWAAIIEAADYFVGVDSCGQHMAYAFDKPGSVIIGSTFAENISYPKHFNIVEKPNTPKVYSPIRIEGLDSELANRVNDSCMDFTKQELEEITNNILKDIQKKVVKTDVITPTVLSPNKSFTSGLQKTKSKSKKSLDEIIELNKTPKADSNKSINKILESNDIKS